MVVGTFHLDNPGHDLHNMKVDDVTTPKRQPELADVAERLMRFKPTTVMVESQRRDPGSATLPRYREYLAGTLAPTKSEVVQVGFRSRTNSHTFAVPATAPIQRLRPPPVAGNDGLAAARHARRF